MDSIVKSASCGIWLALSCGVGLVGLPTAAAQGNSAPTAPAPEPAGSFHPVYSLTENRMLAHWLWQEGLLVPMGRPGVAKYLTFGKPWQTWKLNRRYDNQPVALATRNAGWLSVALTAEQVKAQRLTLRLYSPTAQRLHISLNGRRLKPARLSLGWQQVQQVIPSGTLAEGDNRIEFRWSGPARAMGTNPRAIAAVQWIYLGQKALTEGAVPDFWPKGVMQLPAGGGLAYYLFPYAGARLRLHSSEPWISTGCEVRATLQRQQGAPLTVNVTESPAADGGLARLLDLESIAGQVARVELTAAGADCKGIEFTEAVVEMPGPRPQIKRGPPPKYVLFWMIDNARADRFALYNAKTRVQTPNSTRLGQTGTVFEQAYIVGTESRVSHAALWTGMFPKQTRFVDPKAKLPSSYITLPEAIKRGGLYTACWVANGNISKFWGFAEGWNYFRNTLHHGGGLTGKDLADHGIAFIKEHASKPFFLYLGTIDPHVSWRGRQPWLGRYDPHPYQGKFQKNVMGPTWDRLAGNPRSVSPRDRQRIQAIYDSTVSYNDQQLGRVLAALEEKGIREQTMVLITADHGEEFWEYGRSGHGASCRDTVVKVPLIIHYPPLFGSGVRIREGVDVISAMATILDALGLPIPETVQAASLLPLAQGVGGGYPRPRYATQYEFAYAMGLEHYKLRVGGKGVPKLYDMSTSAAEHRDLSRENPLATRWLTDALSTFLIYQHRWRQARWGLPSNHLPALSEDLMQGTAPPPIRP